MREAPSYHKGYSITGEWDGESYLLERPAPMHNLTWTFLWRLFCLRLNSPRGPFVKLMIADYGYKD